MDCPKCKGLMMLERFSDFFLAFYAWKCVNCGAVIDRTMSGPEFWDTFHAGNRCCLQPSLDTCSSTPTVFSLLPNIILR
jgi:hypothetical protein